MMSAVPPWSERSTSDLWNACESIDAELDQWFARLADPNVEFDEADGTQVDWLGTVVEGLQRQHAAAVEDGPFGSSLADLYESPIAGPVEGLAQTLERLAGRVAATRELIWLRIERSAPVAVDGLVDPMVEGQLAGDGHVSSELVVYGSAHLPAAVTKRTRSIDDPWRVVIEVVNAVGALVVVFVLYAIFATGLQAARSQRGLEREFDAQLRTAAAAATDGTADVQESGVLGGGSSATDDEAAASDQSDEEAAILDPIGRGDPVAILSLPTIGSRQIVVEGTRAADLARGPGHLRSTPLPGRAGNAVVFGRRTTHGGPFSDLDDLRPGDPLDVSTTDGVFRYVLQKVTRVGEGDPDPIGTTFTNRLTLITSDEVYSTGGRLVAIGYLQGAPVATPTTADGRSMPLPPVNPDELGIQRTGTNWALAMLWSMALAIVYLGARWLYRHWLPWSTWLVSAPVVLLVAFGWLDSVTLLLPSTL